MAVRDPMTVARFWSKVEVRVPAECWPWTANRNAKGYGSFQDQKAHRIAYELLIGEIPVGLFALHRCDNPACCNPSHMFLGTIADNNRDMDEKGRRRSVAGARHPNSKLSEEDVAAIRASNLRGKELADRHRVAQSTISMIRSYKQRREG